MLVWAIFDYNNNGTRIRQWAGIRQNYYKIYKIMEESCELESNEVGNSGIINSEVAFSEKLAKTLSYVFDGSFISVPIYIAICLAVAENLADAFAWAMLCILFNVLIPYFYILFLYRKREINDLHIPLKRNRIKPLAVSLASYAAGYLTLHFLKSPLFLKSIFAISITLNIIYIIITFYWKISLHASWIAFVVVTLNVLFGSWMLLLLPLVPIVGWARIKIKRHTLNQVILGAAVASAVAVLVYSYYGFINLM